MYQSILVPLDGSAFADNALPLATSLALKTNATIHLVRVHLPLHAAYTEGVLFYDDEMDKHFEEQDRAALNLTANKIKSEYPELEVTTRLLDGEIAEAIALQCETGNHDLVVMTTHGRGAFGRLLLGSVADQLIRRLPGPVLLVRATDHEPKLSEKVEIKNILIPLDGSELSEQILDPLIQLAKITGARCTLTRIVKPLPPSDYPPEVMSVLHSVESVLERLEVMQKEIQEKAEKYLAEVADRLRAEGLTVETRVDEEPEPATAILHEAKKQPVDLIALSTHARHGLSRLFLGSVANKLIRSADVPILVQRPKTE